MYKEKKVIENTIYAHLSSTNILEVLSKGSLKKLTLGVLKNKKVF